MKLSMNVAAVAALGFAIITVSASVHGQVHRHGQLSHLRHPRIGYWRPLGF